MLRLTAAICALAACVVALTFLILVQLETILVDYGSIHTPAIFCLVMLTVFPFIASFAKAALRFCEKKMHQ